MRIALLVMIAFFWIACSQSSKKGSAEEITGMKYIFDMVHNNPGEDWIESKYTDPSFLKMSGYNGMVPHCYINCAGNKLQFIGRVNFFFD